MQISLKYVYNNRQLFEIEIGSKAFSIVCFIVYNKKIMIPIVILRYNTKTGIYVL